MTPQDWGQKLIDRCGERKPNLKTTFEMIEKADLDYRDEYGTTALMVCASQYQHEIAEKLIEKKVDMNVQRPVSGITALIWGTQHNANKTILMMIKAGVDVNLCNYDGESALHIAARAGNAILVKALIEAKADVNKRDNKGYTPLMRLADSAYAAEGITACAQLLLEAGAEIKVANEMGEEPLDRLRKNQLRPGTLRYPVVIDMIITEQQRRHIDMVNKVIHTGATPRKVTFKRPKGP